MEQQGEIPSEFDFRSPQTIAKAFATMAPAKQAILDRISREAAEYLEEAGRGGSVTIDVSRPYGAAK